MNPLLLLCSLYVTHYLVDRFILHGFVYRRLKRGTDPLWLNFYAALNFSGGAVLVFYFGLGFVPHQVLQTLFPILLLINWRYPPAPLALYQEGGPYTLIQRQRSQSVCLVVVYATAAHMALKL